jgi:hypothetical protein
MHYNLNYYIGIDKQYNIFLDYNNYLINIHFDHLIPLNLSMFNYKMVKYVRLYLISKNPIMNFESLQIY